MRRQGNGFRCFLEIVAEDSRNCLDTGWLLGYPTSPVERGQSWESSRLPALNGRGGHRDFALLTLPPEMWPNKRRKAVFPAPEHVGSRVVSATIASAYSRIGPP